MPDIAPFDYRTLSDMFDLAKQQGTTNAPNLSAFSAQAGQATGRPDLFQQGLHDSVFKQASVGIDKILESSGATNLGASIGQNIGDQFGQSDLGQSVGRSLPRSIVNFLPLAASGVLTGGVAPLLEGGAGLAATGLGAVGAGTLAGSQTYADTGSGAAGVISGLGMAVLPHVAEAAGQFALSKMGGVATDEAGKFIAQTLGEKAVQYGASQAAAQGVMEAQGEAESKVEGQGFYNPLDPKHLVQSIAGQLPFSVYDLLHMGLSGHGQSTPEKVADSIAAPEQMQSAPEVPVKASEVVPEIVPPSDEQKQGTLFGKQLDTETPTLPEEKSATVPTDEQTGQGQLALDKSPESPKVDPVSNATAPVTDGDTAIEKVSKAQDALTEAQAPPVNDKVLSDNLQDEVEQNGGDIDKATENVTQSVANDAVDHSEVADRAKRGRPAITDEFINQRLGTLDQEDPEDKSVLDTMQRALAKTAPQGANSTDYSRTVQRITASWLASDRDGGIQKLQGNLNRAYQNADAAPRSQPIVAIPEGVDRTDAAQMSATVDHLNSTLPDDSNEQYKYGPSHKLADGTQSYRLYKEVKQINTGSAGLENISDTEGPQLAAIFKSEGSVGTSQVLQDVGSQFGTAMRNIERETLEDELTPFVKGATDEQHSARADALQDQYAAYMDALTNDQDISAENVNSKLKDQGHAFGEDEDVQDFAESPLVANVHSYLKDNVVDLDKLQELSERQMAEGQPGFADDNLYDVYGSGGQRGRIDAGAGLDYGLEPIDENGKVGKHTVSKSGNVTEDWLQKNGGTDNQPLQKGEVELYKQLVPEAFKNGGVDLRALQEGLRTKGPVVETKVLGDVASRQSPELQRRNQLQHELDSFHPPYYDENDMLDWAKEQSPEIQAKVKEYIKLGQQTWKEQQNADPQYSFLGPKSEQNMPGYVEGLVREPNSKLSPEPHFDSESDPNRTLAWYRAYEESLPDGSKALHLIEVQSRKEFQARESDHPLAEASQRLALKAAIAHAKEIGATKIILSDGETAMMTEGHDKAGGNALPSATFEGNPKVGDWGVRNSEGRLLVYPDQATAERTVKRTGGKVEQVTEADLQPTQSGGMRLAYDQTLPSALKKLTGDGGERVELGQHKAVYDDEQRGAVAQTYRTETEAQVAAQQFANSQVRETATGWLMTGVRKDTVGSPVFRNPDGTPKSSITGRMYDLSNVSPRASKLFGSTGERGTLNSFNETNRQNSGLFGIKTLGAQFFKDLPPMERAQATQTMMDIASKLRQESTPTGELVADKESGLLGAALQNLSKTKMGTYLLDLMKTGHVDLNNVGEVSNYVFAHESMHHVIDAPEMQQYVKPLRDMLTGASPEEHMAIISAMRGEGVTLPEMSRQGASLPDRGAAAEETMANIGASLTMKSLEGDTGWLKDMTTYLPKPVGDFLMAASDWVKKMVVAIRGLAGMPDVSGVRLSPEMMAAGQKFAQGLEAYGRTNQEVRQQVQQFMQLQNLDPIGFGVLQQAAQLNPLFTSGITFDGPKWAKVAHDNVGESFGLKKEKGPLEWMGGLYSKYLLQPSVDAVKHDFSKAAYGRPHDAAHELALRSRELMVMLGADVKSDGSLNVDNKTLQKNYQALSDKGIQKAFSDIGRLQNRGTADGSGVYPATEFAKLDSMKALSPEKQQTASNLANIVWNMTRRIQDFSVETQTKIGAESIGKVVQGMNKDFSTDKSRQLAGLLQDGVERLRSQDTSVQADGNQLLTTARQQMMPESFNEAYQFAQGERDRLERLQQFYQGDPRFMSEQRLNNYLVRYTGQDGKTGAVGHDQRGDAIAAAQKLQQNGATNIKIVPKAEQGGGANIAPDGVVDTIERLEQERDQKLAPFMGGPDSDEFKQYAAQPKMSDMLREEIAAKDVVVPGSNRRFAGGADQINMLQGQFRYLQAALNVLGKKQVRSSVGLDVMDPQFTANPDVKARVLQHTENIFTPDSVLGRGIAKLNFFSYLAFSPSTALVQSMHTVMSHAPYLAHEGAGIVGAGKITASSASKIASWVANGRKWANPEYDALMRYAGPEITGSSLDELYNEQDASLVQAARMSSGQDPSTLDKLVNNPVTQIGKVSRLFFDTASKFNSRMALLSGYDLARSKGMSIPDAQKAALDFHRTVNFVGGKLNRPTGLFSTRSDLGRTASQVMYSLQSFNYGMIGMMGHYIADAKGNPNARKALVTMLGTQLLSAGAIGLPGMGIAVGLLEKLFPTMQLQKNLVQGVQNMVGDDDQAGGIVSDIALHGVLNQLGIDMSSRVAFGSSFLGARAYDGFSLQDLGGPTYNILKNAVTGVGQISQGNVAQGASMLGPAFLKRLLNAYTNDGTVRSANGAPLLQPTTGQKFAMAIGFTPSQLSNLRQAQQIQQRAQQVQRLEVGQMTQAATQAVQQGDYTTAKQIVQQYGQGDPSFDPVAALHSIAQHAVDEQNPVDVRRTNSNATGVAVGLTGGAPAPSDVTRLMQRGQVEQGLGLQGTPSASDFLHAFQTDQYMQQNPTVSRQQARQAVAPPKFQTPFLFGSS